MAMRAGLTERRSFKDRCMWGPGNWKNNQEIYVYHQSFAYRTSGVALEGAGVDLHIGTGIRINCSALLSWMFRPGNWSTKKVQERSADQHSFTYVISGVGVEGRVMDDKSSIINVDGASVLESCMWGPPDIERKFELVLFPE
jgi:hypothetical protein